MHHIDIKFEILVSKWFIELQEATKQSKSRVFILIFEARPYYLRKFLVCHGLHSVTGMQELIDPLSKIQRYVFSSLLTGFLIVTVGSAFVVFVRSSFSKGTILLLAHSSL